MSATKYGIAAELLEDTSAGSFSRLSLNQIEGQTLAGGFRTFSTLNPTLSLWKGWDLG